MNRSIGNFKYLLGGSREEEQIRLQRSTFPGTNKGFFHDRRKCGF